MHLPPDEDRAELLRKDLRTAGVDREALFVEDDPLRARLTFHNLRDTGLTWMAVRGDDPMRIQWRAGHTTFKTTQGYIAAGRNMGASFGKPFPALPRAVLARGVLDGSTAARRRVRDHVGPSLVRNRPSTGVRVTRRSENARKSPRKDAANSSTPVGVATEALESKRFGGFDFLAFVEA